MLLYHRNAAIAKLVTLSLTAVSLFISFRMQPISIFGFGGLLLFAVAAIGSIQGLDYLFRYLRSLISQYRLPRISKKGPLWVGMAIFGFTMMGNYAFLTTARLLTRDHTMSFALIGQNDGGLSWSQAAKKLKQIVDEVATKAPRLAATRLVAEKAELIDLPKSWGIVAYRWQSPSNVVEQNRSPSTFNSEKNGTL